jgi:aminopeptidase-like protein
MAILTRTAAWLASEDRHFSYRIVFAPGTIGSLCWLRNNETRLNRIRHGLVLGLLGDAGPLTYKCSRRRDSEVDRIVPCALRAMNVDYQVIPFEPYGYDERQFCSPGFDLPMGRLTRSANDAYPQYHSSADDLKLITAEKLQQSLDAVHSILNIIESNFRYRNLSPKGEPHLGKRGLYGSMGGNSPAESQHAMLWVLNQSDGSMSLADIAERSGLDYDTIKFAADRLAENGLLVPDEEDK